MSASTVVDLDPRLEEEGRREAALFRESHRLGTGPIKDVIDIAETALKADVALVSLPCFLDSLTTRDALTGTVLIAVGTTNNPERQRFSVAHELGHLVFDEFLDDEDGDLHQEAEGRAHAFARHFLLPATAMTDLLLASGQTKLQLDERALSDVVSFFEVSATVVSIQLREEGWISEASFDEWTTREAGYLARRYGWSAERETRVIESETERPAKRMLANATEAYVKHFLALPTLAHINGSAAPEALRASLESDGIRPTQTTAVAVNLDDLE